ncbi:MAG: ATP-binding protein, partial [Candidatus Binatia bacterium]
MPFVGRSRELRRLGQRLTAAADGHGGLALLLGEPGIGKTRTAEAFADLARQRGAVVLWGRCHGGEPSLPYGPFAEAIAAHLRQVADPEPLLAALGPAAVVLARVLPELGARLGQQVAPMALKPEEERLRLLSAVTGLVVTLAQDAPVLLVLEDLHWADAGVLAMLRQLLRRPDAGRVLVLATHRSARIDLPPAVGEALEALRSDVEVERIALGGLDRDSVSELLERLLTGQVPAGVLTAMLAATDGNPLFIQEWLRQVLEHDALSPDGEDWRARAPGAVPAELRQMVARRVERLSEDCRQLLHTAAAFGGAFEFAAVAAVLDFDEARALAALEEGLAAQFLRTAGGGDRYEFAHAMISQALEEESSPSRRLRRHRAIAEALERLYGARA